MSNVTICLEKGESEFIEASNVNSLPCRFSSDAKTKNVETFFENTIQISEENPSIKLASFRGRPLKGSSVELPQNYSLVMLEKGEMNEEGEEYVVAARLGGMQQWNLDHAPCPSDKLQQALAWTQIAHSIHSMD